MTPSPTALRTAALALLAACGNGAQADGPRQRVELIPQYQQECAACHIAYPPNLLPPASWQRLMQNLPRHFGTDASLDAATVQVLSTWLAGTSARTARLTEPPAEDRITQTRWFVREHRKVAQDLSGRVDQRHRQITFRFEHHQIAVRWKQFLDGLFVMANFASDDALAGRTFKVILEIRRETIVLPKRQSPHSTVRDDDFRNQRIRNTECGSEIASQRTKELVTDCRRGAFSNLTQKNVAATDPTGCGRERLGHARLSCLWHIKLFHSRHDTGNHDEKLFRNMRRC